MSTGSKREELEAAARRAVTKNSQCTATGPCKGCEDNIAEVLHAADAYASAFGADLLDQLTRDRRTADRRDRLEEALEDTR